MEGLLERAAMVNAVIVAATVIALGLRLYLLSRPGYLLGVTEYDDGPDFGSAIRLVHGHLPYRDFIIVQPPGITLLMSPVALLTKGLTAAWGMAAGRILTAVAGGASVALAGLLVRHRGLLATVAACGILAVYPSSIQSAHTVLLEPWLVLFCLAGAVAVFDGDRLTDSGRRLALGGAAFGFAGAVKLWAVIPVAVILVLAAHRPRRAACYLGGAAAGFVIPVLPFFIAAPRTFYNSVIVAQLIRVDKVRTPLAFRLHAMTGLTEVPGLGTATLIIISAAIVAAVAACSVLASRITGQSPPPLECFALAAGVLVVAAFLWPSDFYYHYASFLAPFLALAIALPVSRLMTARSSSGGPPGVRRLARPAVTVAGIAIIIIAAAQFGLEAASRAPLAPRTPGLSQADVAAAQRVISPGACVLADQVSYTIAAGRFISRVPGCSLMVDSVGTDYSLSRGRNAASGAARFAAVRAAWLAALRPAQYVWLSGLAAKRVPWNAPQVASYFHVQSTHDQARTGLGRERRRLARQAFSLRRDRVDVRLGHGDADHRGPRRRVRRSDRPGGIVVHGADTALVVADAPDAGQQQFLERRGRQGAPARRPSRGHRGGQLHRVRVGEQVDMTAARHEESHSLLSRRGQRGQCGGQVGRPAWQRLHGEGLPGPPQGFGRLKPRQHPVDRTDPRWVGGRVDQERQTTVPGTWAFAGGAMAGLHLEVGRVAMVPVRDQRLAWCQVCRDRSVLGRIGHGPQAVPGAVAGLRAQQRRPGQGDLVGEAGRDAAGASPGAGTAVRSVVEQEDRLQVCLGRLHELPPARHRPRHDLLVR
jgi:Glycosyltransferase family 87